MSNATGYTATFEDGVDGVLVVDFVLNAFSHTLLTEVNPFSAGTIIGSVGGAWGEKHTALNPTPECTLTRTANV